MAAILVAEDDERLAALIRRALTAAGHRVEHVADGVAAANEARSGRFDLVLLDIGLPRMDGLQVLAGIRETAPGLPVLIVTADNAPAHVVAGLQAGADDYVVKPFRFDELVARVETRLRSVRTAEPSLACGGLVLDLVARTVSGPLGIVALPSREFELLEYFMRRPGRVLSREQLLRDVWGYASEQSSNVVDVYVRYLRQKAGADCIQTVRGEGYRMAG
jgi:DNA-binding response OmpR family regulator